MTPRRFALLLAVTAAGCSPTGIAVSIDLEPGCPVPASFTIEIDATPAA